MDDLSPQQSDEDAGLKMRAGTRFTGRFRVTCGHDLLFDRQRSDIVLEKRHIDRCAEGSTKI